MPDPLPPAGGKRLLWLTTETYEAIRRILGAAGPALTPDPTQFDTIVRAGKKQFHYRGSKLEDSGGGGGAGGGGSNSFCEIYTEAGDTFLRGGVVYCGDKNFNVPGYAVDLTTDSEKLIYLEIGCEANRDDDGELLLSRIKTSAETAPASFWHTAAYTSSPATQYPDNTPPPVASGIGKIIIPIGRLVIASGAAAFTAAGCGNITIDQCAGTLTHTRS